MATPTRDEQEDAFAKRLYDIARAAGLAAREAANGLISVRFVGIDEVGIGSVDLCATSLDWKTLQHVALYLGEQVAAAKAATKRKELTALRSELSMFATQAAGSNAQPLGRRVHAPRAGAVRPPDLAEHI